MPKQYKTTYTYGPPEKLICEKHGEQDDPYVFTHNGFVVGTFCTICICDVLETMSELPNDAVVYTGTSGTSGTPIV